MVQEQFLCITCHHNMELSNCSTCIDKTQQLIGTKFKEKTVDQYKYMCKIVINDPKEFERVNPIRCPYYFPIFFNV